MNPTGAIIGEDVEDNDDYGDDDDEAENVAGDKRIHSGFTSEEEETVERNTQREDTNTA